MVIYDQGWDFILLLADRATGCSIGAWYTREPCLQRSGMLLHHINHMLTNEWMNEILFCHTKSYRVTYNNWNIYRQGQCNNLNRLWAHWAALSFKHAQMPLQSQENYVTISYMCETYEEIFVRCWNIGEIQRCLYIFPGPEQMWLRH